MSSHERRTLLLGLAVGLLAASIGALYTVFARWGLARGMLPADLTALRFGTAGLVTLPVLWQALRRDKAGFLAQWRLWMAISLMAGTPFGLLMFGALQFAPASHAAVFPFAAMSVMGMLLGSWVLSDPLGGRRVLGIALVLVGLLIISDLLSSRFSLRSLFGDAMFMLAGALWAGFGVLLRRHSLPPLLATAVISFSALVTYGPVYLGLGGAARLLAAPVPVLLVELGVQGLIAGVGTLYSYASLVRLLGPGRAAVFPALAPGLATCLAWPVLGHMPGWRELFGLVLALAGLLLAVGAGASFFKRSPS